jgi:hypothetical protein
METTKRIVIMLILGLLAVGPSQSAEKPAKRISNTRTASCLVKITCDPAILPPDSRVINFLLRSSAIGGKAAREVLDLSTDEAIGLFTVEYLQLPSSDSGTMWRPSPKGASRMGAIEGEMDEYEYAMMMEQEMEKRSQSMPTTPETHMRYGGPRTPKTAPTTRRTPSTISPSSVDEHTYLFGLNINLREEVKPAAKEFMIALVENLRRALRNFYAAYVDECNSQLESAEHNRDWAQTQLAKAMEQVEAIKVTPLGPPLRRSPADAAVYEQLEEIVDLSNLTQGMPFEQVISELKHSVDPPLQIQPNWKELLEMAELEPTTPALVDPLTGIKLRKALEVLVAGVSSERATVSYVVDEGVILIATEDALPRKNELVTAVYQTSGLDTTALVQLIQNTIEPGSWRDASKILSSNVGNYSTEGLGGHVQVLQKETGRIDKGNIVAYPPNKLVILQTYEVHGKIEELLRSMTADISASIPLDASPEMHLSEKRSLLREKQSIEMEMARLLARQSAIERQIAATEMQIAKKLESDPVTAELQQLVEMHTSQLALMERQFQAGTLGSAELAAIKEKLTRAKIELAQRHEQLSKSAGGDQLTKYNNELADKTIEFAEKTAALQVLSEQLGRTEQQYMTATVLDPQVSRIRQATRAFEIADQRVDKLNARIVNLQPPVVSILGAE